MKYWFTRLAKIEVVIFNLKKHSKVRLTDTVVLVHDKPNKVILLIEEKENTFNFCGQVKAIIKNQKDLIYTINELI